MCDVAPSDATPREPSAAPPPMDSEHPTEQVPEATLLSREEPSYSFYAANFCRKEHKLGQVYSAVARFLRERRGSDWRQKASLKGRCDLVLGEAQAEGVEWTRLGASGSRPLVNFYRGFKELCRKTMMAQNLRNFAASRAQLPRSHPQVTEAPHSPAWAALELDAFLPKTFVFTRSCEERDALILELRRRSAEGLDNTWILKPSGGAHGDDIAVLSGEEKILEFLEKQQESRTPWVVQKYLENPLLLPGRRKFDVRCMVLVTHDYAIHLYSEGILRSCSVEFTLDDLDDRFAHLANHCLQEHHPNYGAYEPLNLLSYVDFDAFLRDSGHCGPDGRPASLEAHILPQIEAQVVYSLLAVEELLRVSDTADFRCFNLLGYDFMLDDQCNVFLLEVNSSPTTDPRLIPRLVEQLVQMAVDPLYPPHEAAQADGAIAATASCVEAEVGDDRQGSGVFKLIHGGRSGIP